MPNNLDQYSVGTTDWRGIIKQNTRRTYIVIFLFFLIYTSVGVLLDLYIYAGTYPTATISELFQALVTFQLFPLVTLIMFGIAAISLFVSYALHDRLMLMGTEYHEVTPQTASTPEEKQLWNTVEEMKISAGLRYMPKVFIIEADYMNAFASGYSEKSAMVAITRGLLQKLNRDEIQAVMAHELSHIRHMDIKLTLTASLLANLTIMVLDIFFYNAVFSRRSGNNGKSRNSLALIILIIRYLLPVISILLIMYLSRKRELMADAGCVELMRNNQPLASALLKIQQDHVQNVDRYTREYQQTPHENVRQEAYLYDPSEAGIRSLVSLNDLFSTHPSMDERLAALGFKKKNQ